ncbi:MULTISPECIES: septum formation family protein [unclassified Corynebacterium]|uniref:septum formation family protein n=1 Tax=unclassified Corynebacterium TaxID=2624378 RepID=UPI001FEE81B1|nr:MULTISPECIES: septum formation family protein [unclassified Corynebacterium]
MIVSIMVSSQQKKRLITIGVIVILIIATLFTGYFLTVLRHKNSETPDTTLGATATNNEKDGDDSAHSSFTTANAGACLTWNDSESTKTNNAGNSNPGSTPVSDFEQTSCDNEHRFEVSSREDLSTYPTSEFGDNAPLPDITRQAQLREELCLAPTLAYLGGTFDQAGKYSVASILPPAAAWENGDRTLLCGVQATDENGKVILTTGNAATQDQSRVYAPEQCVAITPAQSTRVVDCAQDHQLEITQIVDLKTIFPEGVPSIEDQDSHLRDICTQAAIDYLGGDDPLYYSTLQPFWTAINENSWTGGSHSANCALVFANPEATFGTLTGSAKHDLLINGQPPAPRPERAPVVNPEAAASVHPPEAVEPAVAEEPAE